MRCEQIGKRRRISQKSLAPLLDTLEPVRRRVLFLALCLERDTELPSVKLAHDFPDVLALSQLCAVARKTPCGEHGIAQVVRQGQRIEHRIGQLDELLPEVL